MNISDAVLKMFNDEISHDTDANGKDILLELDSDIFGCPGDDLHYVLNKYEKEFNVDLSGVNWSLYYPWQNKPLLDRWFKLKREEVELTRLPLTVRMFAESAEAGKWLYD
ncbi:DUF1493 family protein [Enterobacteriaceae bacterium C23F]